MTPMLPLWQFTSYALPSLLSAVACLAMALYVWPRRSGPGTAAFLGLLASLTLWSLCQALAVSLTELTAKIWVSKVQYLGIAAAPLAWFLFALSYTGLSSFVSRGALALLCVVPLVTVGLAFSNEWHGLLWSHIGLALESPFPSLAIDHGPWFSVQAAYAYLLVLLSAALTAWSLSHSPHQRRQLVALTTAPLIVLFVNLTDLAGLSPPPFLDLTPLSFALGALVLGYSLLRHGLFDLVPIARAEVIEGMNEAVLVLDERGRVLDLNPAAQRALGLVPAQAIGSPAPRALEAGRPAPSAGRGSAPWEIAVDGGRRTYEAGASALRRGRSVTGQVLVLRETTTRKQAEEGLLRAKEELQRANEQLALLANTDALTGLGSRRLFLRRLAEEAARARRHRQPLSVLMLDLDFFKSINDTYGHVVGDQVLVAAGGAISAVKRESDIAGRIGGEEFGLILPATDLEGARIMAERLRRSIASQRHLTDDGLEFAVTASLGVATFASGVRDETELLNLADAALYYAKELGRDRVCVAGGPAATVG